MNFKQFLNPLPGAGVEKTPASPEGLASRLSGFNIYLYI